MRPSAGLWAVPLLSVVLLCLLRSVDAESSFPASFVLLPLDSFVNSSLVAEFACRPTYAATACSGHGQCMLLVDSAQPQSAAFVNASSSLPIPAASFSSSALNPHDFLSFTMLPASVCVCDGGWSGRGDFINHLALDGDSCGTNQRVIVGMCSTLLAICVPVLLLSIHRLYCWIASQRASPSPASGAPPAIPPSRSVGLGSKQVSRSDVDVIAVAADTGPRARPSASSQLGSARSRYTNITFVHPLCSLVVSACLIVHLSLRLWTDATVGTYWLMGALLYVHHVPACIALCANALSRLRLLASFARSRSAVDMFGSVVWWARRMYVVLNMYAAAVWLIVLLAEGKQAEQQQLYAILVLTLCYTSDICVGLGQIVATRSISHALSLHIDRLSVEQRAGRLKLAAKLRCNAVSISIVILSMVLVTALLVAVPAYRQPGLPYYALCNHFITVGQAVARFHLIKPPKRSPSITVAPEPARVQTMGGRKQSADRWSATDQSRVQQQSGDRPETPLRVEPLSSS